MARGFESKDVEYQQAEAERARSTARPLTPDQRAALDRRRTLQLARARAEADLQAATSSAHRRMLTQAIAALAGQLDDHTEDDAS
jgi:hypothetical protein